MDNVKRDELRRLLWEQLGPVSLSDVYAWHRLLNQGKYELLYEKLRAHQTQFNPVKEPEFTNLLSELTPVTSKAPPQV